MLPGPLDALVATARCIDRRLWSERGAIIRLHPTIRPRLSQFGHTGKLVVQ